MQTLQCRVCRTQIHAATTAKGSIYVYCARCDANTTQAESNVIDLLAALQNIAAQPMSNDWAREQASAAIAKVQP